MLKAGALFYSIIIALLMALVSSAFIMVNYHSMTHTGSLDARERLIRNAQSAINLLLSDQEIVALDKSQTLDLYQKGTDSVLVQRRSWGLYEIDVVNAFSSHMHITKVVQAGERLDEKEYPALYLADQDKPLSLCGRTILKGNCFLPKAGLKRAYIEGESFSGDKLVDGQVLNSDKKIPDFDKDMINAIIKGFDIASWQSKSDSIIPLGEKELRDTLTNSFLNHTICLYSKSSIVLGHQVLNGNIAVISEKSITVAEDARLSGVVLYAPKIIFAKNVKAGVQAFAADSIIINENCELVYPSAAAVLRKSGSPDFPYLTVKEGARLSGVIFAWEESANMQKQVRLTIDRKTEITGQVYSSGLADIKGTINGSLMCSRFMLSTPSSVYENHLLNAEIDRTKLSPYFAGVHLLKESGEKRIIKWLE